VRRHPATVRRIHLPVPRICAFLAGWALSSGAAAPWAPGGAGRRLLLRLRLGALPPHLPTSSVPAGRRRLSPGTGAGGPDLGSLHWRGPLPPVRALLRVVGAGLRHVLAPLRVGSASPLPTPSLAGVGRGFVGSSSGAARSVWGCRGRFTLFAPWLVLRCSGDGVEAKAIARLRADDGDALGRRFPRWRHHLCAPSPLCFPGENLDFVSRASMAHVASFPC